MSEDQYNIVNKGIHLNIGYITVSSHSSRTPC